MHERNHQQATLDDPTIRRCRGFAKLWDCNGLAVANVYALISNDPAALWSHPDPIGPGNDDYVWNLRASAATGLCMRSECKAGARRTRRQHPD
ncbi:DUF1643 domain-containing protein [Paraburkholderia phymatum]|uniref:DUF1643 domain-containing protein n=1 Tax=Paraburkholderia phymatum TaxID=148447 RepID=A0ACC6U4C7_9BURK